VEVRIYVRDSRKKAVGCCRDLEPHAERRETMSSGILRNGVLVREGTMHEGMKIIPAYEAGPCGACGRRNSDLVAFEHYNNICYHCVVRAYSMIPEFARRRITEKEPRLPTACRCGGELQVVFGATSYSIMCAGCGGTWRGQSFQGLVESCVKNSEARRKNRG
jgi:hypothetical protein